MSSPHPTRARTHITRQRAIAKIFFISGASKKVNLYLIILQYILQKVKGFKNFKLTKPMIVQPLQNDYLIYNHIAQINLPNNPLKFWIWMGGEAFEAP
jgi:hypothetical protein